MPQGSQASQLAMPCDEHEHDQRKGLSLLDIAALSPLPITTYDK
jgi:hypothetical protein